MAIEASARRHGVSDDMTHAHQNHWRAFATDDPAVTMFVGPSQTGHAQLTASVVAARHAGRSWSEIATMLGVSKQAAQRRYAAKTKAA